MNTFEQRRQYPIKFYQNSDGTITYESVYISGKAPNLESAMHQIAKVQDSLIKDLYLYDDVTDVQIGSYEVADKPRKSKRSYLSWKNQCSHRS